MAATQERSGARREAPGPAQSPTGQEDHDPGYSINRRHRHWEVIDPAGQLVCLTVYKRGAREVVRRLAA